MVISYPLQLSIRIRYVGHHHRLAVLHHHGHHQRRPIFQRRKFWESLSAASAGTLQLTISQCQVVGYSSASLLLEHKINHGQQNNDSVRREPFPPHDTVLTLCATASSVSHTHRIPVQHPSPLTRTASLSRRHPTNHQYPAPVCDVYLHYCFRAAQPLSRGCVEPLRGRNG